MKIIQLTTLKAIVNVTFSAQDTALTAIANGVEAAVEKDLGLDLDSLTDDQAASIEFDLTAAAALKWRDTGVDIWAGGILRRALFPLKVPPISGGETA